MAVFKFLSRKQRDLLKISAIATAVVGTLYGINKAQKEYKRKDEKIDILHKEIESKNEVISVYENIYLSRVVNGLIRRVKASEITEQEKDQILIGSNIKEELMGGIADRFPDPEAWIDYKLDKLRKDGNYIRNRAKVVT